jgi:hypothetical protein
MGVDSFYHPVNSETSKQIEKVWNSLTNSAKGEFRSVEVA